MSAVAERPKRVRKPGTKQRDRECSEAEAFRRIDKVLEREILTGVMTKVPPGPKALVSGVKYPLGPFQNWLRHLRADVGEVGIVAHRLGVSPRRVTDFLAGEPGRLIDAATVERYCARAGCPDWTEVYPHGADTVYLPIEYWSPRSQRAMECTTPECREKRMEGSRFCGPHAERLAVVRAEYDADAAAFKARIKRKGARPSCCNRLCMNPRLPSERFCDDCQAEGFTEDDYS